MAEKIHWRTTPTANTASVNVPITCGNRTDGPMGATWNIGSGRGNWSAWKKAAVRENCPTP